MGPIGVSELIVLLVIALPGIIAVFYGMFWLKSRAMRLGYRSTREYMREPPRTDEQRRDAADLAMKGLVICLLGIIFPSLVLAGLIPLFYGGRKIAYASMGLGLVDDSDSPSA
jgi:hypothetical protein